MKKFTAFAFIMISISLLFLVPRISQVAEAATISHDTTNKIVTMNGSRYTMVFKYNGQALISSLVVDGKQTLDTSANSGIYSAIYNGAWVTTQSIASPAVTVNGTTNVVTATLSTSVADETWTFTVTDSNVKFKLDRTYKTDTSISEQGTPMINFGESAFEHMRWPGDGGNFPVGGTLVNNQRKWLSAGPNFTSNVRVAKEQISYTMLNPSNSLALSITGTSNRSGLARGQATEVRRVITQADPAIHALRLFVT
ncbi:MAG TPA: hypothetical protein VGE40_06540, partial [Bacilli bacterium]